MKNLLIVTVLSLLTAGQAFADWGRGDRFEPQRERIELRVNKKYKGYNIIKLKQQLRAQHPRLRMQNLELVAVKLKAKSQFGKGQATLLVGQNASYPETVPGNPIFYKVDRSLTYSTLKIQNPSYSSLGKWQLELRGKIKVKKLVVIVKNKRVRPTPRPRYPRNPRRGGGRLGGL